MPKKVLIDCDPGIDDALAIALAHGSPELRVVGLSTVSGNVGLAHTTDNALRLVEFYGMDVPVARGTASPLVREARLAGDVHGSTGLGDVVLPEAKGQPIERHAVDFIIDTLAAAPGEISLVAVGPLTNIALALRKEPRIAEWAREFVVMGGSYTRGNTTPTAEFNILADPEAAAVAFAAGWRPVLIGLDLTLQARVTAPVRERFATGLGRFESELLTPCLGFLGKHAQYRDQGPPIHDACAVSYVLDPDLIGTVPANVRVETKGEFTSGMTVVDFRPPEDGGEPHNAYVATTLRPEVFWDRFVDAARRVDDGLPAGA